MLTQKDRKNIRSKLVNIYKTIFSKKDINYFESEIIQLINNFNKKNPKKIPSGKVASLSSHRCLRSSGVNRSL